MAGGGQEEGSGGGFPRSNQVAVYFRSEEGHQKGWWVYEPEATNREHLARMEGESERREALQRLIDRYELAWYGLRQPGMEEFKDCERWVQRLEASV